MKNQIKTANQIRSLEDSVNSLGDKFPAMKRDCIHLVRAMKTDYREASDKQKVYAHYYQRVHRLYNDANRLCSEGVGV